MLGRKKIYNDLFFLQIRFDTADSVKTSRQPYFSPQFSLNCTGNSLFFFLWYGISLEWIWNIGMEFVRCEIHQSDVPFAIKFERRKTSHTRFAGSVPDTVTVSDDMLTFTYPEMLKSLNVDDRRWQCSPDAFACNCNERRLYYRNTSSVQQVVVKVEQTVITSLVTYPMRTRSALIVEIHDSALIFQRRCSR